jgi:hypothetical protein
MGGPLGKGGRLHDLKSWGLSIGIHLSGGARRAGKDFIRRGVRKTNSARQFDS